MISRLVLAHDKINSEMKLACLVIINTVDVSRGDEMQGNLSKLTILPYAIVLIPIVGLVLLVIWRYSWDRSKKWKSIARIFPPIIEATININSYSRVMARLCNINLIAKGGAPIPWLTLGVGHSGLHLSNDKSVFPSINRLPNISIPWNKVSIDLNGPLMQSNFTESFTLSFENENNNIDLEICIKYGVFGSKGCDEHLVSDIEKHINKA